MFRSFINADFGNDRVFSRRRASASHKFWILSKTEHSDCFT